MNKNILAPTVASVIIISFGCLFHLYHVKPNDWGAVALWLPLYIAPVWIAQGLSVLSERKKNG